MCLLAGLIEPNLKQSKNKDHKNYIASNAIARYYGEWMKSDPFDIG